jgi:hypothetical protein
MTAAAPIEVSAETKVQRELLRLALHNSAQSVVMQLSAFSMIAIFGFYSGCVMVSILVGVGGLGIALWRLWISKRNTVLTDLPERALHKIQLEFECNVACSGLVWSSATLGIYPSLVGTNATAYVGMVLG